MTFSAPDFAEKTISSSDGTNIYAISAGNPKHSALVFIHGFGLSSLVFEGLLRESALLDKFYLVSRWIRLGYRLEGFANSLALPIGGVRRQRAWSKRKI